MTVIEKLLQINKFSRTGEKQNKIQYIVVHWVGNANTSAIANRNYFNNLPNINRESKTKKDTYASSHYIVGLNGEIIRCIPDDEVAFHSGSYGMNRKSIGIENCHPDWGGKFNSNTYNSLVDLVVELCKKYSININNVIRHYDVTGKVCPKYYVENTNEWTKFRNKVNERLNGTKKIEKIVGSEEKPMYTFKNGKTIEYIYADSAHTKKIGYLNKWESCECYGIINGAPMVKYRVGNTDNFKVGFAKDVRCVVK